jgi:hypothetical protein
MKKEYVKPENRVVKLKDRLMDGNGGIGVGSVTDTEAKFHFEDYSDGTDYSDDSPKNLWDD